MIEGDDEVVIHMTVADSLIVASAVLSVIKSLFACGSYSCFHILLAVLELACTAIALALFVIEDFLGSDGTVPVFGGDDTYIFLLAFGSSCVVEIIDVFMTYVTVRAYKLVKETYRHYPFGLELLARGKTVAKCAYTCVLIVGVMLAALTPILSFWKSGWAIEYFSPSPFSPQNGQLLLVYMILMLGAQVIIGFSLVVNLCCGESMESFECGNRYASIIFGFPASIIIYVVLARVTGAEAGSLTYFLMLGVYQGLEMGAEAARMSFWIKAESGGLEQFVGNGKVGDDDFVNAPAGDVKPNDDDDCDGY